MAGEGVRASLAPQVLPAQRQGRSTESQTSAWGMEGAPESGSLFFLLHVARLNCSMATLTHAGRIYMSPASAGACSVLQALPSGRCQGCRSTSTTVTIFPCILPLLPMITNTYTTSATADGHAANPTALPATVFCCIKSRGRSQRTVPRPPAVCAMDDRCLLLRCMAIQRSSVSSRAAMKTCMCKG